MSDLASTLLLRLKDYSNCNDDLAVSIRKTVLEPFQVDISRPDALRKPPPTPSRFKQMAAQLAPLAMRIVNQNIDNLAGIKRATSHSGNYTVAVNCLVDTSFYALTALRHMNTFTSLKPLDIEKTTSNLICKMVELGEYNRALDEIRKFRSLLASVAKVQLSDSNSLKTSAAKKPSSQQSQATIKGVLTESPSNYQPRSPPHLPDLSIKNQWEDDMLNKYQDLFIFPLDKSINDRTMILLVLAYQMNTIRCWCELADSSLAKYVPYLIEKPGSFFDWCKHLLSIDERTAKNQLDTLQRLLYKVANRYPLTEDAAIHTHTLQIVALKALALSKSATLKAIMDRMVRIGITYEKATSQTLYSHIQKCCNDFLENLEPNVQDLKEMDSYFVLCEYYAYASRKAKSYKGAFFAYKYMIRPLRTMIENPLPCNYYYAAYAANAKLALGSVQMDKMVLDDTFADISTTLNESIACLRIVSSSLDNAPAQDEHCEQALYNLCKSIDGFRQSARRLYEFISEKTKRSLIAEKNERARTPPRMEEILMPSNFGQWNSIINYLTSVLQQCSETLPINLHLSTATKKRSQKRVATEHDILISFIDIMALLARIQFNLDEENTYQQAYEYLSTAEQMCAEKKFNEGYRWLSGSYYNLGTAMIKIELYKNAIYPLRKSSSLLEKDTQRASSDEGKLQLCKRYEILGICCQKNNLFDDAIKAYRLALKRIPVSAIEKFTSQSETMAVTTMIEQDALIPKLMDRFLRASVIDPYQEQINFASEYVNLTALNPIRQGFLYECELKVWNELALKMNLSKYQLFIVDKLLQLYDHDNYPIRRARVLLTRLRIEKNKTDDREVCTKAALECAKEVSHLLKVQDYAQDSNLLNYRRHYLALATSWTAICSKELNEELPNTFASTLQQWGVLLKKVTPIYNSSTSSKIDIQRVYNEIDDLDHFYDHIRMLADLFAVTGEQVYHVCALRILLKLNNGLRDVHVDHVSESIILTSTIGKIYCDMGYTGKASIEFNQAKLAISSQTCSNASELVYRINYSYYLMCIGDYETSKEVFDATRIIWDNTPLPDKKDSLTTIKQYTTRCILLADAYTVQSYLQAHLETLDKAINSSTAALQLLNKCIQIVQKSDKERQEKPSNTELENPFMPATKRSTNETAAKIVFRESQWVMAQKLSQCFTRLAQLHMTKGSWNEAKYFVKQGPTLADKVRSIALYARAYLCSSEFYLRCGDLIKSQAKLEHAIQLQTQRQTKYAVLDEVRLKMAMAQLALQNLYFDIAIETFEEANLLLAKLSNEMYISNLEELIDLKEERLVRDTAMFEDEVELSDMFESLPLQRVQTANIVQKAIALSQKGDVKTALNLLEKLEDSGLAIDNEIELNAAIAQLKIEKIRQELNNKPEGDLYFKQSMILPPVKLQTTRAGMSKRTNVDHDLRMARDNLTQSLERMLEASRFGWPKERSIVIRQLCSESGFAMFLKNQISSNSRILVNNHSLLSSYLLSMANGINMRREFQNCLKIKTNVIFPGRAPSDKDWPLSEEEQQERCGRIAPMIHTPEWLDAHLQHLSDLYQVEHELDDGEFQEKFVDILPANWTVCSLTVDPVHNDVYAVQLRANETPFVVKLPMNRMTNHYTKYEDVSIELKEIIQGSDETIHNSHKCTQPDEIEAWWTKRKDLDGRLKQLLENMEQNWFSGFKGILTGRCHEHKEELIKFQKSLNEVVYRIVNEPSVVTKKQLEFGLHFCRMVLRLGRQPSVRDLEDLAHFMLFCYKAQDIQVDHTRIDLKKLVDQIRLLMSRYHEKCSMIGVDSTSNISNDHVILILDKCLQMFPIESMPILRPQSVSRLPCLSFLRDRILYTQAHATKDAFNDFGLCSNSVWTDFSVSKKSAYYVLNPGGDLKDTQKEFEPLFKGVPEWKGVIQSTPIEIQCKDALQTNDIYMYFGHSAGQAFMRGTTVRQLSSCAVSLLMGCSSGVLEANGEFDPYGYVLNYLLAGSPAVVANLWDVTDRSIDRLTKHMLHSWGMLNSNNNSNSKSLVQAVAESRNQCKLTYLIGAAPVVYGIPVYIKNSS